jgi:hypothetical protein
MRFAVTVLIVPLILAPPSSGSAADPVLKFEADPARAFVPFLSWDTEGGDRAARNLLRPKEGLALRLFAGGAWRSEAIPASSWTVAPTSAGGLTIAVHSAGTSGIEKAEIVFAFDPAVTPTTVLPATWADDGTLRLPAVLNAPDFGQMLLTCAEAPGLAARLPGSRAAKTVDLVVEIPAPGGKTFTFTLTPVILPPPAGLRDLELWRAARRGWWGALEPSSAWGDPSKPFSAPPGILGNNVISDPASCSLWFYADQALWTPEVAPGVSAAALVRRSIDFWLENRTRPTGEVVCYWDYGNFLDANAGPLIAAWDHVESTGDMKWLEGRIERLEFISEFLARRDLDGDGMVEATQSGNLNTLRQPARSCAWWDALNCGHKDGYTNAVIYRAWRCLADLERRLGRAERAARWTSLADRLKGAYRNVLHNPKTGWLGWWRSADGELHDYASPTLNGIAIEYGLVDREEGRRILDLLWKKIDEVGFRRLDLGIPPMLVPVRRGDYLQPDGLGCPSREDGTDTFGQYQNGGITAGHVLHFLAAHYVVGAPERADRALRAMLERQARGEFQNGVTDAGGKGIDWTTWDGKPSGYEGYLADGFRFLQAVLLREAPFRERYYRPLGAR